MKHYAELLRHVGSVLVILSFLAIGAVGALFPRQVTDYLWRDPPTVPLMDFELSVIFGRVFGILGLIIGVALTFFVMANW
jgi:hypothetical protein